MKYLKNILNLILNMIYPRRCIFCYEISAYNDNDFICKYCNMELDFIFDDKEPNISVFQYNDKTKFAIHRFKYFNRPDYAKYFAEMMYLKFSNLNHLDYDFVIFVPMYKKKKLKRGYDQAELLAKEFSKISSIPFLPNILIRIKNTIPQSKVSFEDRNKNVEDCFRLKDYNIFQNKNLIIIDDIYTSGNTMMQCIKEINKSNPKNVCIFTLAKVINK